MRRAANLAAHGRFVEVPSGHAPFIGHAPTVARAVIEFVAALPS
jgi:hypothetical protein